MESIKKLCEWLDYKINCFDDEHGAIILNRGVDPNDLYDIVDEIESEIAEKYMVLPLDADGVPIRVGETVYDAKGQQTVVKEIAFNADRADVYCQIVDGYGRINVKTECLTHVKPRTVEDVLEDMFIERDESGLSAQEIIAKYAAELRMVDE